MGKGECAVVVGCFFFFEVPEHVIQASRFSASGRKSAPRAPAVKARACRSCQPMRVLSFGEGRSFVFVCLQIEEAELVYKSVLV